MSDSAGSVNSSSFPLSQFGKALGEHTGIGELMEDLGEALADKSEDFCMLGGGQPAAVPEMISLFQERLMEISSDQEAVQSILGEYDPAEGNAVFRHSFAKMMKSHYGWELNAENIGISAGGQSACFHLMNALAGEGEYVMIPLLPDYMGYRDQLVSGARFYGVEGKVTRDGNRFKYQLDRKAVGAAPESVRLMAVSRPTNPSGNVLSDDEIRDLSAECKKRGIPLLIDHAYGAPFPCAVYTQTDPHWEPHHIHLYSFSKLGLPGLRTSIIIAHPSLIKTLGNMTAVTSLANPNLGQSLLLPYIQNATLPEICAETLTPFYKEKRDHALQIIDQELGAEVDYAVHAPEGAFFLWIWLPTLTVTSARLVEELKKNGVLAISGHWFFYGKEEYAAHSQKCLRLTYSMPQAEVEKGIKRLAQTLKTCLN